jgi:hypothetical protein
LSDWLDTQQIRAARLTISSPFSGRAGVGPVLTLWEARTPPFPSPKTGRDEERQRTRLRYPALRSSARPWFSSTSRADAVLENGDVMVVCAGGRCRSLRWIKVPLRPRCRRSRLTGNRRLARNSGPAARSFVAAASRVAFPQPLFERDCAGISETMGGNGATGGHRLLMAFLSWRHGFAARRFALRRSKRIRRDNKMVWDRRVALVHRGRGRRRDDKSRGGQHALPKPDRCNRPHGGVGGGAQEADDVPNTLI